MQVQVRRSALSSDWAETEAGPRNMLFLSPKFPERNCPNSDYYARIMPNYADSFPKDFPALCGNFRFAYYAESNAGILRLALDRGRGRAKATLPGRGLHSFTFRLNVSAFCGIGGVSMGCLGAV